MDNFVQGNFIGTDARGIEDSGNTIGVFINNAPFNTIGGAFTFMNGVTHQTQTLPGNNLISGNDQADVLVFGNGASDNLISNNIIGLNSADNMPLMFLANPNPNQSDPFDLNDPRTSVGVEINNSFSLRSTIMTSRGTGQHRDLWKCRPAIRPGKRPPLDALATANPNCPDSRQGPAYQPKLPPSAK